MNGLLEQMRRAADVVRRNERLAAWVLLGAIALACVALLTPPIRDRVLVRAQVAAARWDARWADRIERGEALLAEGRYEEAAVYLAELDGVHPARHVSHGRDVERERVLRALGSANLALGRKRASLDALRRAVEFDELNYLNHFTLASAALQLGEPDEALTAFDRVRAIHPNHLPTAAALISHYFEGGDYRSVVDTYQAYLDAYLSQGATVLLGDGVGQFDVFVTGDVNYADVPLLASPDASPATGDSLIVQGFPHPFTVHGVSLQQARRAGVIDPEPIALSTSGGWSSEAGTAVGEAVRIPVGGATGVVRVELALSAFKTVDAETWAMVERSYRNLLEIEALDAARARSRIVDPAAHESGASR